MRIINEKVIDRNGTIIGNDPSKFPCITNRCLVLAKLIETGKDYKIVMKGVNK